MPQRPRETSIELSVRIQRKQNPGIGNQQYDHPPNHFSSRQPSNVSAEIIKDTLKRRRERVKPPTLAREEIRDSQHNEVDGHACSSPMSGLGVFGKVIAKVGDGHDMRKRSHPSQICCYIEMVDIDVTMLNEDAG
jgi:hypothetical protein